MSGTSAATAISRAEFHDAFANQHAPTTPGSFLEHGRIIDWIFARGPVRAGQPQVHRSGRQRLLHPGHGLDVTVKSLS
jgi:hypothetical protein